MRKILLILLVCTSIPLFGQDDSIQNGDARLRTYYELLSVYKTGLADLRRMGINPFVPDYSQEGGGYAFRVYTKLRAQLEKEADALGLNSVQDGRYKASVRYSNLSTGTESSYVLYVTVENDQVVKIHFDNGGELHTGYNEHGYTYSGGYLKGSRSTTIIIAKGASMLAYHVDILR